MDITIAVGLTEEGPVIQICFPNSAFVMPLEEAQQLAVSILVSCGIAMERYKDA